MPDCEIDCAALTEKVSPATLCPSVFAGKCRQFMPTGNFLPLLPVTSVRDGYWIRRVRGTRKLLARTSKMLSTFFSWTLQWSTSASGSQVEYML